MCKAVSYKVFRKGITKYKVCSINVHLIADPFTFNKYYIRNILYMTVTHSQYKDILRYIFYKCVDDFPHTHPKLNNANKFV